WRRADVPSSGSWNKQRCDTRNHGDVRSHLEQRSSVLTPSRMPYNASVLTPINPTPGTMMPSVRVGKGARWNFRKGFDPVCSLKGNKGPACVRASLHPADGELLDGRSRRVQRLSDAHAFLRAFVAAAGSTCVVDRALVRAGIGANWERAVSSVYVENLRRRSLFPGAQEPSLAGGL